MRRAAAWSWSAYRTIGCAALLCMLPSPHGAHAALPAAMQSAPATAAPAAAAPDLAKVPGLERVTVQRYDGVVVLQGEVARDADRTLAEKVAKAAPGVVEVVNRVEVSTSVLDRIKPSLQIGIAKFNRLLGTVPLLLVAALIAWLFWRAGRWLSDRRTIAARAARNPFLGELARRGIRLAGGLIGLLVALQILDAVALAGALLGSAGVVGIALGFAFRDMLENYIASVLLSLRRPFAPNDSVVIDGNEGIVVGVNSRATILMTPDGNHLRLPNALVFKAVTLNHTRNGKRRFDFVLELDPAADASVVLERCEETLRGVPDVLADPAPFVRIADATRDALRVQCFAWVDQRSGDFGLARSEAIRRVRASLKAAGVDFGAPALRLVTAPRSAANDENADAYVPSSAAQDEAHVADAADRTRAEMGGSDLLQRGGARE